MTYYVRELCASSGLWLFLVCLLPLRVMSLSLPPHLPGLSILSLLSPPESASSLPQMQCVEYGGILRIAGADRKPVWQSVSSFCVEGMVYPIVQSTRRSSDIRCRQAVVFPSLSSGLWTCLWLVRRVDSPLCIGSHHEGEVRSQHHVQVAESVFAGHLVTVGESQIPGTYAASLHVCAGYPEINEDASADNQKSFQQI